MRIVFVSLLITWTFPAFSGGPWVPEKKAGFLQLQTNFPLGPTKALFLEKGGNLDLERDVYDITVQAYLEYGLGSRIALITSLPYKFVSVGDKTARGEAASTALLDEGTLNGFGNYSLALKYKVYDKKFNAAISLQGLLNSGRSDFQKGLATAFLTNSVGFNIHIGKGFTEKVYSFIEGGYHLRTNGFSDRVEIHYELGYRVTQPLWVSLVVDLKESLKNGAFTSQSLRRTGLFTNDQEYFSYGIKAAYELKNKLGFNFATFGAFSGNYVAKVATVNIGVFKKW